MPSPRALQTCAPRIPRTRSSTLNSSTDPPRARLPADHRVPPSSAHATPPYYGIMKRHHSGELPLSAPASDGLGRLRAVAEEEEEELDKQGKYDKAQRSCSNLLFVLLLAAIVSFLARHCYATVLAGGVVRIETVPGPPPPSARKIVPIARGELSVPQRSPPAPVDSDESDLASDGEDPPFSEPSSSESAGSKSDTGDRALPKDHASAAADAHGDHPVARTLATTADVKGDLCNGRYIYVQELPQRFNTEMIRNCGTLSPWTDICGSTSNGGFGPQLVGSSDGAFQETGWYDTDAHALDLIFHARIRRYECLTSDPSLAAAVFVPFYAGLDVARHLWGHNVSARDALALDLVDWLTARPEWRAAGGRDHFFVAGRTTWDFRRQEDADAEWGSRLLLLPAVRNMTALVVEASPWHLNDAAVPYPTAFHPASDEDVFAWQNRVRRIHRPHLFAYAGARRSTEDDGDAKSITGRLAEQCAASHNCSLMECGNKQGPGNNNNKCDDSRASVMHHFQGSMFCLIPRDSSTSTNRAAFDAILAGCIPVFFHPGTAYVQYTWHLPRNHADYSVYIPEADVGRNNVSVEETLRRVPPETVRKMREAVVGLIPTVIYTDPSARLETTMMDAFDVAVAAVIDKVAKLRNGTAEEKLDMYTWKYPLLREGQKVEDPHEWDALFAFS